MTCWSTFHRCALPDIAVLVDWRHSRRTLSNAVARLRPECTAEWSNVEARPIGIIEVGVLSTAAASFGTMRLGELKL